MTKNVALGYGFPFSLLAAQVSVGTSLALALLWAAIVGLGIPLPRSPASGVGILSLAALVLSAAFILGIVGVVGGIQRRASGTILMGVLGLVISIVLGIAIVCLIAIGLGLRNLGR